MKAVAVLDVGTKLTISFSGISLVEWPSKLDPFPDLFPPTKHRLDVDISIVPETDERRLTLSIPEGSAWDDRLQTLVEEGLLDDLLVV